jgi:hypothetical protein
MNAPVACDGQVSALLSLSSVVTKQYSINAVQS